MEKKPGKAREGARDFTSSAKTEDRGLHNTEYHTHNVSQSKKGVVEKDRVLLATDHS